MVNGVNLGDEVNNTKVDHQIGGIGSVVTNPIHNNPYKNIDRNLLIDETMVSNEAVHLYQKEQDIKQFSTLAMSNPEDLSHEEIIQGLFNKGVVDPLSNEAAESLSINQRLLDDLSQ